MPEQTPAPTDRPVEFLVVGECVADIVRTPGEADRPYAGGSPANVAYGLARLGRPVALLTQLGDDPMGRLVRTHLEGAGARVLTDGQPVATPTAIVSLDGRGHASYEFAVAWSLDPDGPTAPVLPSARHVHLGSIASVMEPGASAGRRLLRALRESGATVSYDPNVRPALFGERKAGIAAVEECVALSHLVKASDEDLEWLYPGVPAAEAAARWLALGPRAVIVTRGGDGAFAVTAEGSLHADAVPTTVVDTVGAGDSFMSAALDALAGRELDGAAVESALRRAVAAAAVTVSRAGANPPTAAELAAELAAERASTASRS